MDNGNKEIFRKLKWQGYKVTRPRLRILEALKRSRQPLSVEDIFLNIKAQGEKAGITTIYRAVDSLAKAGVIRKLSLMNGRTSFQMIDEKSCGHHHHLICRSCKRVVDYSDFVNEEVTLLRKIEKLVSKAHQFRIEDHQLSFTGLCKLCGKGGD